MGNDWVTRAFRGRFGAGTGASQGDSKSPQEQELKRDGETRTRTGDTTIFSRVLYQLSYLAARAEG
jgi:hypothetical protein